MKPEKIKNLSQAKVRYGFPKTVKFHFCFVFWAISWFLSTISLQSLCMKMIWPQVDFCSGNIYIVWSFQLKKKQLPKILPMRDFVPLKSFEILQLVWILTPNKSCPRCMILPQAIVFHPYFIEITSFISIWLQFRHYGSTKLLKNFKSNFLTILSYHYGFPTIN